MALNRPDRHEVSIEVDGKPYTGWYHLQDGCHREADMLTVSTANGYKTTHLGNTPPEGLARLLLSELVHEGKA